MEKLFVIPFWFASVSLIFVSLFPVRKKSEGLETTPKMKERAVIAIALAVSISFTVLILVFMLETGYIGRRFDPVFAITAFIGFLFSVFWWRGIIKIQREALGLRSPLVQGIVLMFILALCIGLLLTNHLWDPPPPRYRNVY
ncbi:MAG: hypothetical protein GX108_03010 [Thermovirga sp.]|nr:hypothetical protein [Thermovirga sp.]